jgi:hypothetical protein
MMLGGFSIPRTPIRPTEEELRRIVGEWADRRVADLARELFVNDMAGNSLIHLNPETSAALAWRAAQAFFDAGKAQ